MEEESSLLTEGEFSEYVNHHAAQITPREMRQLVAKLPQLRRTFQELHFADLPRLAAQLEVMADALEAFVSGMNEDIPLLTAAEIVVVLLYLQRSADVIPESLSEMGFSEDASLVNLVIQRNAPMFQRFAASKSRDWSRIAPL